MNNDLSANDKERTEAINWMRNVLISMLEVCPLSYQQRKVTGQLLNKMPDWLMGRWADSLNIDYLGGKTQYPDMVELVKSDVVRNLAQQYLEYYDVVAVGNCLEDLGKSIVRRTREGDLPVDTESIEKQVCALALVGCIDDGIKFVEQAGDILSDAESDNHPIVDYHLALEYGDRLKFELLDAALTGGRYGSWVTERLNEAKRFLGFEPPHFTTRVGERTPQWDLLWKRLFTGGDE